MRSSELVVGNTYFMVVYPEPTMSEPIVITYRYLGTDLGGPPEDPPQYHFRYLPAFQDEGQHELEDDEASWREILPSLFSGWGADMPTAFAEAKLSGLVDLGGLIEELSACRDRRAEQKD